MPQLRVGSRPSIWQHYAVDMEQHPLLIILAQLGLDISDAPGALEVPFDCESH